MPGHYVPVPVNYIDKIVARLEEKIPGNDVALLRLYALLALTTGTATTLENVHDAWSAWRTATKPGHQSLVPFAELTPEVQEYDRKYMDAIREVAPPVTAQAARQQAGEALVRAVLEAVCLRDGLSLESSVEPGAPARNYELGLRLNIGHVFGVADPPLR